MILTLCNADTTLRITISPEAFALLRSSSITAGEVDAIAAECAVDPLILRRYVADLCREMQENIEMDASCDYTDHFS